MNDIPPKDRVIPDLIVGNRYYICYIPNKVQWCILVDVFESKHGVFAYIVRKDGSSNVRPYCIGKNRKQAIDNFDIHNSYSPNLSDLKIVRPYLDRIK